MVLSGRRTMWTHSLDYGQREAGGGYMRELKGTIHDLRAAFRLVPWRMRPKLVLMALGSAAIAFLDMAAVVLLLPVMQLVSGATPADSPALLLLSELFGVADRNSLLLVTLGLVAALMIAKSLFSLTFRWWSVGVTNRAQTDATAVMMDLYMTSPFESHRKRDSGDIYTALNSYIPSAFGGVTNGIIQIFVDGLLVLAVLVALMILSPLATVLAITFFGTAALAIQAFLKNRLLTLGEGRRLAGLRSWRYLTPAIHGLKQARLSGASQPLSAGFTQSRREENDLARQASLLGELPRHLLEVVMVLGIGLMAMVLSATTGESEAFTILGVFAVASVRIIPSLNRVIATVGGIRGSLPNLSALEKEIRTLLAETDRDSYTEQPFSFPDADVIFSDLSFTFQDGRSPVLDRVSGKIPRGSTVALVGSSGAGKTTFVDLLTALLFPTSGSIQVGGVPIHAHPISWRRHVGVVPQDIFIWDESVRSNIAYGIPDAEIDDDAVRRAVTMAQLDEVVADLPSGLDTVIGYQGTRLSGGQRQRVGIARALYRDPQVLILDEATSALDNQTEAKFTETIEGLRGKMTIVVVAHRLSTVKGADEILFFDGGQIRARGTMAELTARDEKFAELVRLGRLF